MDSVAAEAINCPHYRFNDHVIYAIEALEAENISAIKALGSPLSWGLKPSLHSIPWWVLGSPIPPWG